jgi:DNA polymerase-3 subunit gamma/tau
MAKRKETAAPAAQSKQSLSPDYTVLARRYRPQQFGELIGQEAVARALVNALSSNRVAHAYLFTGARGVGKTSTARILAKALNCVKGPTATPCDQCEICQSIASGEDVDVLEIDGASNNGVDEIRDLRQNVQYRPARARYKIYIIDEVHMLSKGAFNALLKTLEEPPGHVKFIFATTEAQKIPITILSRCQRFDFLGVNTTQIVQQLKNIVASEDRRATDEALEVIARRARGSMRDSQSLLDQLFAFANPKGELTVEDVHQLLGTANEDRVAGLADAILRKDAGEALAEIGRCAETGLNLGELADQLIDYWRDLMILACGADAKAVLSVSSKKRGALVAQAKSLALDTILSGLDVLSSTRARLRGTNHPRVLVELAVVRLARLEELVSVGGLVEMLNSGPGPSRPASPAQMAPDPGLRRLSPGHTADSEAGSQRPGSGPAPDPGPRRPGTGHPAHDSVAGAESPVAGPRSQSLGPNAVISLWPDVLNAVGPMLGGSLEKAAIAIRGPKSLVLTFAREYNREQEHCQESARLSRIEEAVRKVTGQEWAVRIESSGNAAEAPAKGAVPGQGPSRYRRQRAEALQEPLVKRAAELFGAQIVHIDDDFGTGSAEAGRSNANGNTSDEET